MKKFLSLLAAVFLLNGIPSAHALEFPFIGFLPQQTIYSTNFTSTENPISEGGRWTGGGTVGLDWQNARTTAGSPNKAYGANTSSGYNDCLAVLSGFSATQSVQATVYRDATYTPPDSHEIELLLRFQITANNARGYEIDFSYPTGSAIVQVIRWNGALNDFTVLGDSGPNTTSLNTGDVIKASMTGSTITVYKNGSSILTATDATFSTGNPGMAFFIRPGGTLDKYCISQLTARSSP